MRNCLIGFALVFGLCSAAMAQRTVYVNLIAGLKWHYISLSNPSSVAQNVTVTFRATGDYGIRVSTPIAGYKGMSCSSTTLCTNKATAKTIAPGGNLMLGVETILPGNEQDIDPNSGISVQIDVAENTGYLLGKTGSQYFSDKIYISSPIMDGHPF